MEVRKQVFHMFSEASSLLDSVNFVIGFVVRYPSVKWFELRILHICPVILGMFLLCSLLEFCLIFCRLFRNVWWRRRGKSNQWRIQDMEEEHSVSLRFGDDPRFGMAFLDRSVAPRRDPSGGKRLFRSQVILSLSKLFQHFLYTFWLLVGIICWLVIWFWTQTSQRMPCQNIICMCMEWVYNNHD